MEQIQAIRDAIAIVQKAKEHSTDIDAVWNKLKRVRQYLDDEASQLATALFSDQGPADTWNRACDKGIETLRIQLTEGKTLSDIAAEVDQKRAELAAAAPYRVAPGRQPGIYRVLDPAGRIVAILRDKDSADAMAEECNHPTK